MKKAFLGLAAILLAGACHGQGTGVVIFTGTNQFGAPNVLPVSTTNPLAVNVVSGTSGGGGTVVTGTVSAILTGTQNLPVAASLSSGTTVFSAGVKKIDMLFSSDFAGSFIASGTIPLNGGTLSAYTFQPPIPNSSSQVSLIITTGTVNVISFR